MAWGIRPLLSVNNGHFQSRCNENGCFPDKGWVVPCGGSLYGREESPGGAYSHPFGQTFLVEDVQNVFFTFAGTPKVKSW
jgi:hypothetical protein